MSRFGPLLLFLNVLVIAVCGLIYELLAATVASYLLGDSIFQFSTVIGTYLFAMGVGSWLSRFVEKHLVWTFIEVELAVALLGGFSAPILFFSNAYLGYFSLVLYGLVFLVGALVGLEIPLLMRILKDHLEFKELVSRVLAFDYLGALVASLAFPLFLMPSLGVMRTSMVIGLLNAGVALWATWIMRSLVKGTVFGLRLRSVLVMGLLVAGIFYADYFITLAEEGLYADRVVYARTTPYQRIVVTRNPAGVFRLYLNGHLQFNSADEYRYHEALVHPAMSLVPTPRRVLILGGGDGLGLREVLRHDSVEHVTLVDLDPGMTSLSDRYPPLGDLNQQAYHDPRVRVVNQDAYIWVEKAQGEKFDVVIIDFPDPHSYSLGKLYTTRFYRMLKNLLAPGARVAVQSTSPFMAPRTYWCIVRTLEAAGFKVKPYHVVVPSFFGVWGFSLAALEDFEPPAKAPSIKLRYLNDQTMSALFVLPEDMQPVPVDVNRLDNQVVVQYHETEWKRWSR